MVNQAESAVITEGYDGVVAPKRRCTKQLRLARCVLFKRSMTTEHAPMEPGTKLRLELRRITADDSVRPTTREFTVVDTLPSGRHLLRISAGPLEYDYTLNVNRDLLVGLLRWRVVSICTVA